MQTTRVDGSSGQETTLDGPRLQALPTSEDRQETPADPLTTIWGEEPAQAVAITLEDDNFWVRDAAVEALGKLGGDEAVYALAPALKDEDSWIRWEAVKALGEVGGESAVRLLERALAGEDEFVRDTAAEQLAKLRDQIH